MKTQTGNGGTSPPQTLGAAGRMDGGIPTARLVQLAQATPDQQALVDAILAGRLPALTAPVPAPVPRDPAGGEPYLNKKEVAERLGIKPRTCDQWMAEGRLVFYKVGRSVRFRWSEIQAHLAQTARVCRRSA